ncbi:hypothetical protein [Variovorax sp. RCC_210]|uniref:hypothetical protein n=1 Tax=Variovorax sp. RCC_210 TaxID=3239217 RepID=UPI000D5DDB15
MPAPLRKGLELAQKLSNAKVELECTRVRLGVSSGSGSCGSLENACMRVAAYEQALGEFMDTHAGSNGRRQLKLCRALYLRMLVSSAPVRLATWPEGRRYAEMPSSQLYEAVSNRLERAELDSIECSLSSQERTVYMCLLAFYRDEVPG